MENREHFTLKEDVLSQVTELFQVLGSNISELMQRFAATMLEKPGISRIFRTQVNTMRC